MVESLNGETQLFPILGDPIKFVQAPSRVTAELAGRGYNGVCVPMQVPEADLEGVVRGLSLVPNVRGLLITMPHKFSAYGHCSSSSEGSRLTGVVSVMRRNQDGSWHGDMLDGLAFVKAQKDNGAEPNGARALLVGAGGAGSSIAIALLEAGVRELIIHDTNGRRAAELVELLAGLSRGRAKIGPPDPTGCDMVFNATPMGMAKEDALPVEAGLLAPSMFVGDVIAGHGTTPLMKAARAAGCRTADGMAMVEAVLDTMLDFLISR